MKKIVLGIALLGMLAGACGRVSESKKTEEEPFTELLGELEPGSLGDSVMVHIGNGEDDTVATYPILDDMFAVILKTDRMKAGSIMIKYDEGISSGFFIPEGGKIRIRMDREGRVRIDHESKKSSLTKEYVTLSEESDRLYYGLIRERDSVAKAEGLTGERYDSLDASFEKVFNERTMEQSLEVLKKHPDDVLGVLAIKNMLSAGGASKAREMIGCLSEEARNHPSLPDSLKF